MARLRNPDSHVTVRSALEQLKDVVPGVNRALIDYQVRNNLIPGVKCEGRWFVEQAWVDAQIDRLNKLTPVTWTGDQA